MKCNNEDGRVRMGECLCGSNCNEERVDLSCYNLSMSKPCNVMVKKVSGNNNCHANKHKS